VADALSQKDDRRSAFITVLSSFSAVQMAAADIQIVADYYTQDGAADYIAFLRDVDEAFQEVKDARAPREPQPDVAKILDTLQTIFTDRHISARGLFPAAGATIAKYTFERILAQSAPILTAAEVGAVAQNFAANSEVNIDTFAAAVDVRRDADSDLLGRVVSRMRAELDARKFLLRPVLTRFDRSGSGEIGRMQFLVALQDRHVPLGT
jgi:hypothetical protein